MPAPFGPTRPIRSPSAIAASIESRITNVPTSRVTPVEAEDRHQAPAAARAARRAASPRPAACAPPGGVAARSPRRVARLPSPSSSVQRRPRRRRPPVIVRAGSPRRPSDPRPAAAGTTSRSASSGPDDDPLGSAGRSAGTARRCAGRRQALLHRAVAVGRGVVIDRGAAPLHGLGQDPPDRLVEAPLVRRAERPRRAQRMQPRAPQRLVGVDVADACQERLVEQQRLQAALAASDGRRRNRAA